MDEMSPEYLRYAWIDLETTGTKPGAILEICCIITDCKMNVIAEYDSLVMPDDKSLDNMNDFVRNMHTDNGLLDRLKDGPALEDVEQELSTILKNINDGNPRRTLMVGNSIGSLDLPYIRACMPKVAAQMHYRSIDMTGVRLFMGMMSGQSILFEKKKNHRAKDDILECQEEAKYLWSLMDNEKFGPIIKFGEEA